MYALATLRMEYCKRRSIANSVRSRFQISLEENDILWKQKKNKDDRIYYTVNYSYTALSRVNHYSYKCYVQRALIAPQRRRLPKNMRLWTHPDEHKRMQSFYRVARVPRIVRLPRVVPPRAPQRNAVAFLQ